MTPKQERFVQEYLIDLNATQAAIRAGYSPKTAQEQSSRLLSNAIIRDAVAKAQGKRTERTELTQDWVLGRLVENVERAMTARPVLDSEGESIGEFRYEGNVANRALELLGKHLEMFVDRSETTIKRAPAELTDAEIIDRLAAAAARRRGAASTGAVESENAPAVVH